MPEAAIGLAAGLLALEVASRLSAWKWLRRRSPTFRFSRYGVPLFLAYVLAVGLSFGELPLHQSVTAARMTVGSATFLAGWLVRYSGMIDWLNVRLLTPDSRHAWWGRVNWLLPVRHPGYVGAILEAAGVACILSSVAGGVGAVLVLPTIALVSARWEEHRWMARHQAAGVEYSPPNRPAIAVPWQTAAVLLIPLALVYLFAAFLTREVEIFTSGVETGRTLMLSVAGAQGTLGVLALTLIVVLVQMTTAAYSGVLAGMVWPDRRTALALTFLVVSIIFDVVVVARSDSWLAGDRAGALVDSGLFLAALAMVCVLLTTLASVRMVAPERLMLRVLQRLDALRMAWAAMQWPCRFGPRTLDPEDPMRSVQALLRELILKGDLQSLRFGLAQLRQQLEKHRHTADTVSVHGYCHYYLGPLVDAAASETGAEGLEEFLNFVYFLGLPSPEWIKELHLGGDFDPPPGELLLREIVNVAVDKRADAVVGRGLRLIQEHAGKILPLLPRQEETMTYNPDHDYSVELAQEEKDRLWHNEARIQLVEHQYIDYFGSVAEHALAMPVRCETAAWYASGDLSSLVTAICRGVVSTRIRELLVVSALYRLEAVARAVCEAQCPGGLNIMGLHHALEALDSQDAKQVEAIDAIAATTGRIVQRLGRDGLLRYGTVVDAAMVGVYAGVKRPKAALMLVEAMGRALQEMPATPGFDRNDEAQFAVKELRKRIEQVAWEARGEGAEEVRQAAKGFLEVGDESEAH